MGQFVVEKAHLNTNQEKYNEGYERIFGKRENVILADKCNEADVTTDEKDNEESN